MGNCASTDYDPGAAARSAAIDRQIEEDSKIFRKECKILLLGAFFPFKLSHLAVRARFREAHNPSHPEQIRSLLFWLSLTRGRPPTLLNVVPSSPDHLPRFLQTFKYFSSDGLTQFVQGPESRANQQL